MIVDGGRSYQGPEAMPRAPFWLRLLVATPLILVLLAVGALAIWAMASVAYAVWLVS